MLPPQRFGAGGPAYVTGHACPVHAFSPSALRSVEGDLVEDIIVGLRSKVVFTDYGNFGIKPLRSEIKDLEYENIDPAWSETSVLVVGNIYENPELLQ